MTRGKEKVEPTRKVKPKAKAAGKRVGKSKPSKANNQLNRRVK